MTEDTEMHNHQACPDALYSLYTFIQLDVLHTST